MRSSLPVCAIVYQTATEPFITRLFKNKKPTKILPKPRKTKSMDLFSQSVLLKA